MPLPIVISFESKDENLFKDTLAKTNVERKKLFLTLVGTTVFVLAFFITVFVAARTDLSPQEESSLHSCNVLAYNALSSLNVLFIASREDAETYKEHFLAEPPYSNQ